MHFDEATRVLEISVRELVEEDVVFHRVGFERSQAWRRLALGGEAHRRTQAARFDRFPGYRSEIFVSAEFETPRFRALVSGRIDGAVETEAGSWLVEEYKTCAFTPDAPAVFPPERERRARRQLSAYCLLWEKSGLGDARAALAASRLALILPAAIRRARSPASPRSLARKRCLRSPVGGTG